MARAIRDKAKVKYIYKLPNQNRRLILIKKERMVGRASLKRYSRLIFCLLAAKGFKREAKNFCK